VTSDVRVVPWADLLGGRWPSDAAWAQYLTQRAELASAWAEAVATHRAWVRAGRRGEPPGLGTRSLTRAIEWDAAVHAGTVEQGPPPPHWEDEAIATLRARRTRRIGNSGTSEVSIQRTRSRPDALT
jgi:hypothetical protein